MGMMQQGVKGKEEVCKIIKSIEHMPSGGSNGTMPPLKKKGGKK